MRQWQHCLHFLAFTLSCRLPSWVHPTSEYYIDRGEPQVHPYKVHLLTSEYYIEGVPHVHPYKVHFLSIRDSSFLVN